MVDTESMEPAASPPTPIAATDAAPGELRVPPSGSLRIPVIEETLQLGRRVVERGGYRLTKQVTTTDQIVDEALRTETVEIERRAIGTLLTGSEPPVQRHEGDTLVVPVVREVLVTEKRLMLVEEIRIRRVEASYRDPQRVSLRAEKISIERLESDPSD